MMRFSLIVFFVFMCILPTVTSAQDIEPSAGKDSFFSRFLFSPEELEKLKKALAGGFKKAPEQEKPAQEGRPEEPRSYTRVVSLAGLIYTGPQDWTFWLNGQQITPANVPEEVQDLYVTKYYIDFGWLDREHNELYPIRLRPHQSFHLDTKTFFTGTPGITVDASVD